MIAALIIAIVSTLLAFFARYRTFKYGLELAFILITVFLSLGYNWGNDVQGYLNDFYYINSFKNNIFEISTLNYRVQGEFGWVILNILCKPIGFFGMRIFLFIIENLIIYRLIKNNVTKEWYWLSIALYTLNFNYMSLSSSMMRQWLAMCIIILAIQVLQKKRSLIYILLTLLAFSFHKSAIIFLPFIVLRYFKFNFKWNSLYWIIPAFLTWWFLAGDLIGNFFNYLLLNDSDGYGMYIERREGVVGTSIFAILRSTFYIIMLVSMNQVLSHRRIFIVLVFLSILFLPLMSVIDIISRLSLYFMIFSLVAYPIFFHQTKYNIGFKLIIICMIFFINVFTFFSSYNSSIWKEAYYTYNTIFTSGSWM